METKSVAQAPASTANLCVGFDILGAALDCAYDIVEICPNNSHGHVLKIVNSNELPLDLNANTAGKTVLAMLEDYPISYSLDITIKKGVPFASGMGGSAASAVAAAVALDDLLSLGLERKTLLHYAAQGEVVASGSYHIDNVLPSLVGGLVLVTGERDWIDVPIPPVHVTILHPDIKICTEAAREYLPATIGYQQHVAASAQTSAMIAELYKGNWQRACSYWHNSIAEAARADLYPHYAAVKAAALDDGVMGVCVSGSGPSIIAIHAHEQPKLARVMQQACQFKSKVYSGVIPAPGATIIADGL